MVYIYFNVNAYIVMSSCCIKNIISPFASYNQFLFKFYFV